MSQILKAKINTKSNYNGLNGQWLTVKEIKGTRVSCLAFSKELQKEVVIDFSLKEIAEMNTQQTK